MRFTQLADVGDGLCLTTRPHGQRPPLLVDCGSRGGLRAFEALTSLGVATHDVPKEPLGAVAVTHFHHDHFNGFIYAARKRAKPLWAPKIVYPRLPALERAGGSAALARAYAAMFLRVVGSDLGVDEPNVLGVVDQVNARQGKAIRLARSQGQTFASGGRIFDVIWPPRTVVPDTTTATVIRALKAFETALDADEVLRGYYEKVAGDHRFEEEASSQDEDDELDEADIQETVHAPENVDDEALEREHEAEIAALAAHIHKVSNRDGVNIDRRDDRYSVPSGDPPHIPEETHAANKALRRAANRLSLVFIDRDDDLLVMGDLEEQEIQEVDRYLVQRERSRANLLVTPHHGTHWPSEGMVDLRAEIGLSSNGPRMVHHFERAILASLHLSLCTYTSGQLGVMHSHGCWSVMGYGRFCW